MTDESDVLADVAALRLGTPTAAPEAAQIGAPALSAEPTQAAFIGPAASNNQCEAPPTAQVRSFAPTPMPTPEPAWNARRPSARTNPNRPQTPEEKAGFTKLWLDRSYTLHDIGRLYDIHARTVQKWGASLELPARDTLKDGEISADRAVLAPAATVATASLPIRIEARSGPMDDPEISHALREITADAMAMSQHSDLTGLQRKLSRFAILLAAKAPAQSWPGLQASIESLSRTLLHARKVEAKLPRAEPDQTLLRKEAAAALMRELKSVLTADEQAELGRLVKAGADRLMAARRQSV